MKTKNILFLCLIPIFIIAFSASKNFTANTEIYNGLIMIGGMALLVDAGIVISWFISKANLKAEVGPKKKFKGLITRDPGFTDEITAVVEYNVELPYNPKVDFWNDENLQKAILSARMAWREIIQLNETGDVFNEPNYSEDEEIMEAMFSEKKKKKKESDAESTGEEIEEKKGKHVHIRNVPKVSTEFNTYGHLNKEDFKNDGKDIVMSGLPPSDEERKKRADDITEGFKKIVETLRSNQTTYHELREATSRILELLGNERDLNGGNKMWRMFPTPISFQAREEKAKALADEIERVLKILALPDLKYREMIETLESLRVLVGPRIDPLRNRWSYIGLWKPHYYSDGQGMLVEFIVSHREVFESEFPQISMIDDKIFPPFPTIIQASPVWLVKFIEIQPDLPLVVPMITLKDALRCAGEISDQVNIFNLSTALDVMKRYCGFLRAQQSPDTSKLLAMENDLRWAQARAEQEHNRNIILRSELDDKEDSEMESIKQPEPIVINAGKGLQVLAAVSTFGLIVSLIMQMVGI